MQRASETNLRAAAGLNHAYFTGLILTLVTRRNAADAAEWIFRVFRHQHHEKFLSSFGKLGLKGLPDAVACAAYHYLSNSVGGVSVEFMRESDRKAWVNFVPPRWIYPGASICGVPSEVSRAFLHGWYAQNGVSLGNPRLGFVCTAQTTDGQHGLSGYFLEHDRELAPDERLVFRPGELPPPFDPAAAPKLSAADWPPERLAKAERNYAMEYIRSGLPRLAEIFGPAEAAHLGRVTGRLVGAQFYKETAALLGVTQGGADEFGRYMAGLAAGEGDTAAVARDGVPHRLGDGETEPGLAVGIVLTREPVQRQVTGRHRTTLPVDGVEIPRTGQAVPALHGPSAQAERRLRPLRRRLAITLRPPTVAIRDRKPCRRLRTSLLG